MRNKPVFIILIISLFFLSAVNAQIGGDNTYQVLELTSSARVAALGGDFLAINDNDINLAITNPSVISPAMHNELGVSYVDYFSDINYGFASYARSFEKIGSFVGSVQYINYGEFDYADETGARTGTFYAGETALNIGWGRQLDSLFSIGANLKFLYSSLESYNSYGMGVDVAGSYNSKNRRFTMSLIAKNIGRQLKPYHGNNIEPLPFEFQFGLSQRLAHLPFRYSILYNHIEKWDLRYENPNTVNTDPVSGEVIKDSNFEAFADNLMRHIVIGGELIFSKNFSIRGGYNYGRRQDMKISSKTGTVGFSWGFGFRVSMFHFSYARSAYHLVGSPNYITITTNISDFRRKRN